MLDIRKLFVSSKSNQIFLVCDIYFQEIGDHGPSQLSRYYSTAANKRMPSNGIPNRVFLAIEETWHLIQNILKNNNLDFLLREELFGRLNLFDIL